MLKDRLSKTSGWQFRGRKVSSGLSKNGTMVFPVQRSQPEIVFESNVESASKCGLQTKERNDPRSYGFHVTSSPPCWWTKTKDLSLASFVRPEVVRFSIVIGVSRDWLKTSYS